MGESTRPLVPGTTFEGIHRTTTEISFTPELKVGLARPEGSAGKEGVRWAPTEQPQVFNDVLGKLGVTNWRAMEPLRPTGTGLQTSGDLDPAIVDRMYEAVLRGDASTVARCLGVAAEGEAGAGAEEAEGAENSSSANAPAGAKPDGPWRVTDAYGLEPLSHAAASGHAEVVRALLSAGADADATGPGALTALHRAARAGHTSVVDALVAHGVFIDAEETDGVTALQSAALENRAEVVTALLAGGSSLTHVDASGTTPLMAAAQGGALAVAEAMLESDGGAQLNRLDVNGWSALHHACTCGHAKLAMLFFERGADIEKRTRGGRTIADMDAQIAASLQAVLEARRESEAAAAQEAEAA